MIKVICSTNLDGFDIEDWPNTLQVLPRIGERIKSSSSNVHLKVVNLVHNQHYVYIELNY